MLIRLSQQLDGRAFGELFNKYRLRAYNVALRLLGNSEDAADVVQVAFLRVFRSIANFRGDSMFSTWLYRIVVNEAMRIKKRKALEDSHLSNDTNPEDITYPEKIVTSVLSMIPQEYLERRDLHDAIVRALDILPNNLQVSIILFHYHELSCEEIAEFMDTVIGTVKSRLKRARAHMRDLLEDYWREWNEG